jgi:hypothetical protein
MRNITKVLWTGIAIAQLAIVGAQAASYTYQLDNGTVQSALNASDTTETHDNWFANEFTAVTTNAIKGVQFELLTSAPNTVADVVLYRQTSLVGYSRFYTQAFTPLTGNNQTNYWLQTVWLNTPQKLNVGDNFLVAIFMQGVTGDKFPYAMDGGGSATGSYWDRSAPNTFNLDNLSGAVSIDQNIAGGTWNPSMSPNVPGHLIIRAYVPEPSVFALGGLAAFGATILAWRRRSARS